jgi:hypothetical protein
MAAKTVTDQFANLAIIGVVETGANTLTFKKLETGFSIMEKAAWVISRIEYTVQAPLAAVFDGNGDHVDFGISLSNSWSAPTPTEITILDANSIWRADYGAAATAIVSIAPFVKDFSNLPGGGLILPPNPLYGFVKGTGLVSAMAVTMRLYYTTLALAVDQFWELVEARRVLSS